MARRCTNYDHYCNICGKRIGDGEDYYRCARGVEICIPCEEQHGMCKDCTLCDR